jgi:uncharacterized phage-associated protein
MTDMRAMDVSEYILRKQLTGNLKLQKLLYFVQAYFLIKKGAPCFSDKIYAWDSGPTIPAVYRYFSRFTLFFAFPEDIYIVENEDGTLERRRYNAETISEYDRKLIDEVIEAFSGYTSSWMLDLIKGQDPYMKARKGEGEIKLMDLKGFFE